MARRKGRGFATIEYPTGMNQNGDPSQAWIKLKPDGGVKGVTIRNPADASPVGRNDPCPCGSGKKYKKCCHARP